MPTENRSSNTEMVSVPRALAERISNICMFTMYKEDWRALSEILAKPAEQHQGDAIGTLVRDYNERIVFTPIGDPHIIDDMKVYAHADPGEVERLKSTAEHFTGVSIKAAEEVSRLRAKLIELESSVREFLRIDGLSVDGSAARNKALKMLAATLSASAEQSAPVERDEVGELDRLRSALKFYADREHFHFESGNWDTVSGEPLNILWCGDEPDFIEDGSVARAALERRP